MNDQELLLLIADICSIYQGMVSETLNTVNKIDDLLNRNLNHDNLLEIQGLIEELREHYVPKLEEVKSKVKVILESQVDSKIKDIIH